MDICPICKESLTNGQPTVVLREKGSSGINRASVLRKDSTQTTAGQSVHSNCRYQYCNRNVINRDMKSISELQPTLSRALRSEEPHFQFHEYCLFCGHPAKLSGKKRGYDVFPVRTSDFQTTIWQVCKEREDTWSHKVFSRIEFAQDLHAADAVYHQVCNINFRTEKQLPQAFRSTVQSKPSGRPKNSVREHAFLKVTEYLVDNDDEQITICDLVHKMEEFGCKDAYSIKYMKAKITEYFGENVIITNINGKASVVTFRRTASTVLNEFYETLQLQDLEAEKMRMVKTVANLIKNDIKCIDTLKDNYPNPADISSVDTNISFLPESLHLLLGIPFSEKNVDVKIASVGQAIIQAARPRVIMAPLQIGLAVQMHHHFASKFLIDSLHSQGFCSSYSEVKRFEACAARTQGTDIPGILPGHFVQYIADNADHNINTLDGYNTFHGMGIIAAVTPGTKRQSPVPRCHATNEDITEVGKIDIRFFKSSPIAMLPLAYDELEDVSYDDPTWKLDLMWKVVWPIRSPRPGWSGMMQTVTQGSHPGKSSITYMPMIDMSATDMSCIYSTLHFVCSEARRQMVHPILTFDQPLWWKSQIIVYSEPADSPLKSIVLRLGGFHVQMSFLGCMGHMMRGSGLQELMEVVYAPNTVVHMLSGKALARAVRGHFLIDAALNAMLVQTAFNLLTEVTQQQNEDHVDRATIDELELQGSSTDNQMYQRDNGDQVNHDPSLDKPDETKVLMTIRDEDLTKAVDLYDQLMYGSISADFVCTDPNLDKVQHKLQLSTTSVASSRTARLWIQYMDMVDLLRQFIKAERTGNWFLHLKSLKDMLPFFAATGHNLYAKSVYIYLQQMLQLKEKHPDVFTLFKSGYHVIRRSDRYWAGLSSDLVIEQVLMRNMKTTGGLTRRRGMTDSQRIPWPRNVTFSAVCNIYLEYVLRKYSSTVIVFDGYNTGPSTKDATHMRRCGSAVGPQVNFAEDMPVTSRKEQFLANSSNKQKFINMLSKKLQDNGCKTVHASGDADLLIVQTAVDSASECTTTLIGEDTDLLVLLCFHAKPTPFRLYLKSEGKTSTRKQRIWNINELQITLGHDVCSHLLFVHAIAGCDTTSRLFGIGKGVALKKLISDNHFKQQAHLFCTEISKKKIFSAGEEALVCLYSGVAGETLDTLRYRRFCEKVATSSAVVQVHTLPPTSDAARYHSARVYFQVQDWMGNSDKLDPEDWGWVQVGGKLTPRTTDKPPAPDALLRVIHCKCKTDCDSKRCTCRKHGLDCSTACGECKGVGCTNSMSITIDSVSDDL